MDLCLVTTEGGAFWWGFRVADAPQKLTRVEGENWRILSASPVTIIVSSSLILFQIPLLVPMQCHVVVTP